MHWIHEGVTISITKQGDFVYGLEGFTIRFATLQEARNAIDRDLEAARVSADTAVDTVVLTDSGTRVTLLHMQEGTGKWLTDPKGQEGPYYADEPGVADLLLKIRALEERQAKLYDRLSQAEIRYRSGYGRQSPEEVKQVMESFLVGLSVAREQWAKAQSQ